MQTLNPGVYCNAITLSGSSSVILNSGVYVLKAGIANSSSGPTSGAHQGVSVDGTSGVMIYMLSGGISQSGSGLILLNPMTSGTWKGISLWQPSSNSSAEALSGTTTQFSDWNDLCAGGNPRLLRRNQHHAIHTRSQGCCVFWRQLYQ